MTIKKIRETIYHLSTEDALGILAEQYDIFPREGILRILMEERYFRFCKKFAGYYKAKHSVINSIDYFVFFQNEPIRATDIKKICEKIDKLLKIKYATDKFAFPDLLRDVIQSGVIKREDYLKYQFDKKGKNNGTL